jgi:hypothetical protein
MASWRKQARTEIRPYTDANASSWVTVTSTVIFRSCVPR